MIKSIPISLLAMFLAITMLLGNVHAWSWNDAKDYVNAYNISINNWNYTATYGSNTYYGSQAGFALINVSNIINPVDIGILAYDKSGNLLGSVPYLYLNTYGSNSVFLIANRTINGSIYNNATIFYNRIDNPLFNRIGIDVSKFIKPLSYNGIKVYVLNYNSKLQTPCFSLLASPSCANKYVPNFYNIKSSNITSNSAYFNMNFTLNTTNIGSFVVLANKSLNTRFFNQTWGLSNYQSTQIYTTNSVYKLKGLGLFGGIVSSPSISSSSASKIFNSLNNYEGYYAVSAVNQNQILTQELTENPITINNLTTSANRGLTLNIPPYIYNLKVDTSANTTFYILPSFTSNFIIQNVITNNNPQDINDIGVQQNGWYYNFLYREQIKNINWTYNITTYAKQNWQGIANKIIINSNGVGYAIINITHYAQMGANCQYVYFRDYDNASNLDFGSVPFAINKCNNSSIASFVIYNRTNLGFTYNTLFLYWYSPFNLFGNFGSSNVINNWKFASGSNFNVINTSQQTPFLIKLDAPLDATSNILMHTEASHFYTGFGFQTGINGGEYVFNKGASNVIDRSGFFWQTLLAFAYTPNKNTQSVYITKNLYINTSDSGGFFVHNQIIAMNQTGRDTADVSPSTFDNISVSLANNNKATFYRVYTTQYNINPKIDVKPLSNITNGTIINTPTTIPQTITHINYSNVSISANIILSLGNSVSLFNGFAIPQYILLIITLIVIILASLIVEVADENNQNKHANLGFILILALLWIMSIWQIQLLILVVIISIIFIAHEFIHKKKEV